MVLDDMRSEAAECHVFLARIACSNGHYHIIEKLINTGKVKPSFDDNYGIGHASKYGHIDIVELLLKYDDVDPSTNGEYALRRACRNNYIDVVRLLIKDKRVNPRNGKIRYAIDIAADNGFWDIVDLFIENDEGWYDF
jgi:ankyrin repeat protein